MGIRTEPDESALDSGHTGPIVYADTDVRSEVLDMTRHTTSVDVNHRSGAIDRRTDNSSVRPRNGIAVNILIFLMILFAFTRGIANAQPATHAPGHDDALELNGRNAIALALTANPGHSIGLPGSDCSRHDVRCYARVDT